MVWLRLSSDQLRAKQRAQAQTSVCRVDDVVALDCSPCCLIALAALPSRPNDYEAGSPGRGKGLIDRQREMEASCSHW